jgi:sarcosine oxidase subunit beta
VSDNARLLIVGGGIIGSSLAWALARRGISDVTVVDLDLAGVYASSELNAGGARATWWQPVNIEACKATLEFFAEHAELFGFRRAGYLWLYEDPDLYAQALSKRRLQNGYGLEVEALHQGDVLERFPLIDRNANDVIGATWSPHDGLLNPNAVRSFFRRSAEALGVSFRNHDYVTGVATARRAGAGGTTHRNVVGVDVIEVAPGRPPESEQLLREILTTHRVPLAAAVSERRLECDLVVNCLGAWSPVFSAKLGVPDVTEPVRRQIALVDVHAGDVRPGVELSELGMVVDTSGLYLHAEGSHILAGYSTPDEAPGFDFSYDGEEFFLRELWPRLAHRSSSFERCAHVRGWAGLYAVTPDRSGVAGAVAGFGNLFEAHSFTGRGVMQSWAVGEAMAALIDTGRFEGVDLTPLRRERFTRPDEWVTEALHI